MVVSRDGGGYLVESPGFARWKIGPRGELLEQIALADLEPDSIEVEFQHHVAPMLGQLRGHVVLHAACVVIGAGAVAFVGSSGTGKSTLAALFSRAGHTVLGDDGVELLVGAESEPGGRPLALPAAARAALLREGSLRHLLPSAAVAGPSARHRFDLPPARPSSLTAIFLLDQGSAISVTPVSRRDALLALARNCLRVDPFDTGLLRSELAQLDSIVSVVPVRRLSYPRDFDRAQALLERVAAEVG